jgi:hypothetical protein
MGVLALALLLPLAGPGSSGAASMPLVSRSLAIYRTCVLTSLSATSTVATDTWVNQASVSQNNGTTTTIDMQSSTGGNRRTYIRFDPAKCPPVTGATYSVKSAILRLFVTQLPAALCRTEDVFRVTASWSETGITWANQPFGTTLNNPASGSRTDAITIGPAPCQNTTVNAYVTGWDVTADVQSVLSGGSNFGWMFRDDVEGSGTARDAKFSTREAATLAQSPQLIVTYST